MFFIVSKIFAFVLAPVHFFIFLAVIGATLLFTRWKTWGRALSTVSALALLLMAFGPLGGLLAGPLEARFPPPPDDMPAPDGIIVLGGTIDERLSASRDRPTLVDAAERLTAPIALKRKYPNARLVFTGGSAALQASPYSEADAVQRFWREIGLDQGDVLYERRSRNTLRERRLHARTASPQAWRALAARHLGDSHAARRRRVPSGGLRCDRLSGRLSHQRRLWARIPAFRDESARTCGIRRA